MLFNHQTDSSLWKGALSGLAGGLVAAWVMNQFQAALSAAEEKLSGDDAERHPGDEDDNDSEADGDEPATVKTASVISEGAFGHELSEREKKVAGPAVHYAFGGSNGALYGAAAEVLPEVTVGAGLSFGTVLWLTADEAALPVLGLAEAPTEYPPSVHAESFAAHLVFGLTTELVRRGVRRLLG